MSKTPEELKQEKEQLKALKNFEAEQKKAMDKQRADFEARSNQAKLIAGLNKAEYERMYYYLEARKISKEFQVAIQEDQKLSEEMQEKAQIAMDRAIEKSLEDIKKEKSDLKAV